MERKKNKLSNIIRNVFEHYIYREICMRIRIRMRRKREMGMGMGMLRWLKWASVSRAVHEEEEEKEEEEEEGEDEKGKACPRSEGRMRLTVWRKSLVMSCKGFTVIDSEGNLVYRVDNYMGRPQQITLMDASGKPLLTLRRRTKLVLVDRWFVYGGEEGKQRKWSSSASERTPICCVRKHVNILQLHQSKGDPNVQAYVYRGASDKSEGYAYKIEGSYAHRKCKVLDDSDNVVAEIKRKQPNSKHVSFGVDIFQLIVHPGCDPGFAMALVLLLDQMFS